jgi:uncharacterized protein YcaQ
MELKKPEPYTGTTKALHDTLEPLREEMERGRITIVAKRRGEGKTYDLVQWMLQDPGRRAVVVPHHGHYQAALHVLKQLGGVQHSNRIVEWSRKSCLRVSGIRELAVDEALNIPAEIHGIPVVRATVTITDDSEVPR